MQRKLGTESEGTPASSEHRHADAFTWRVERSIAVKGACHEGTHAALMADVDGCSSPTIQPQHSVQSLLPGSDVSPSLFSVPS